METFTIDGSTLTMNQDHKWSPAGMCQRCGITMREVVVVEGGLLVCLAEPGEPPFTIGEENLKYHQHVYSSSGATLVAEWNKCPLAGYLMLTSDKTGTITAYPLVRGQLVHTIAMHAVIEKYRPWKDWAQWPEAYDTELFQIKGSTRGMLERNLSPITSMIAGRILTALDKLKVAKVLACEHQIIVPLERGYQYTPRLDLIVELTNGTIVGIDWKTTSMESGAIKEEAAFHGSSTQFQGMYLALEHEYPGRKHLAMAGLIRLVSGSEPLVELVSTPQMSASYYVRAIQTALEHAASMVEEPLTTGLELTLAKPGQSSCHTPYGKCKHWGRCHG